jgi:hypothetical protein
MEAPKKAPLKMPVRITSTSKRTEINLRRDVSNPDIIKIILHAVLSGEPIIVYPYFTNHFQSLGSLQKSKLINYDFVKNTYSWGEKLNKNKIKK